MWLPAKKVGASQARGKWRETERGAGCGKEECFSHILTVTLANSLPLLILSDSSAFRVITDVIPPTSISSPAIFSVSCHSWKCTLQSKPDERRIVKGRKTFKVWKYSRERRGAINSISLMKPFLCYSHILPYPHNLPHFIWR